MSFEEYRQPWETGPHWELKREFMEKYQNDYPLDRLLCLAQAYSNIELLHCSYPDPVMHEVYQLSCQLQGCKRFREADADLERKRKKEKSEMQSRKAGKRSLYEETTSKSFKFIKFCTPQGSSNQPKSSNDSDKKSNDFIQSDTRASTNNSRTSDESIDSNKNTISEGAACNVSTLPSVDNNVIFTLTHSADFGLIQKIAAAIPKKSRNPLESIEIAIEISGLENAVKYVFIRDNTSVITCQLYVGSTLVATGRDATEKTAKERAVQYGVEILTNLSNFPNKSLEDIKQELENWKKATNSEALWSKISSDYKSRSKILLSQLSEMEKNPVYADLHLILGIVEKLFDEKYVMNKNIPAAQKFQEATTKLKCASQLHFFHFGEDLDTLLHLRAFHCDLIIKNIFICHSKASSKKKAKVDASEQGLKLLINFIENSEFKQQYVQDHDKSLGINFEGSNHLVRDTSTNENTSNSLSKGSSSSYREYFSSNKEDECNKFVNKDSTTEYYSKPVANNLATTCIKTSVSSSECYSQGNTGSESKAKRFRINNRLLTNSRNQQLIIFDGSDAICNNTPISIIHTTASRCKKNVEYIIEEIPVNGSGISSKMFRCVVTLNGEEIGKAQSYTEKEAKSNAAKNALLCLQNNVYTVKEKNEIEESFVISRSHVLNAENPSSVLSESNVGCKMLKMMGWSGGGIGKTSGITEPIVANDHRFGRGLGFSNSKAQEKSFKQKIEALLKDYSQSNTTSDLIFSIEFSKEERKEIHELAKRYNLLSNSRGKGEQRQLFIGRKFTPMELLERLIEAGGSTPKYELEDKTSASQVGSCQSSSRLFW